MCVGSMWPSADGGYDDDRAVEEGADKIFVAKDKDSAYSVLCEYIDKISESMNLEKVKNYP